MSYLHARFLQTVGTPGTSGNDITKARVRTAKEQTIAKDEEMVEIFISGPVLVLRAVRLLAGGRQQLFEKHIPLSNVRDLEPLPEEPKKGNSR